MSRTKTLTLTRAIPGLLTVAVAAAIVAQLFSLYLTYTGAPSPALAHLERPSRSTVVAQAQDTERTPKLIADLVAAHLFGVYVTSDTAEVNPAIVLTLSGTLSSADPHVGSAIIAAGTGRAGVYPVGATLPNGASLSAVYTDRALVSANGTTTTLMLPRSLKGGLAALQLAATNPAGEESVESPDASAGHGVTEEEIRDQSTGQLWFHNFIAQPVYKRGAYAGIGLNPTRGYQNDYGVKPGDILKAINGVNIDRAATVEEALHKVNGGTVSLSIERDGAPMTLTLNMDGP